jgi:hypothetical protein
MVVNRMIVMETKEHIVKRRTRSTLKVGRYILGLVALVVVIRLVLPYVVLHYANKSLANINGYYGHIEDIDLAIIRGAYQIDSIYLNKTDSVSGAQTPFFSAGTIDLSLEWKALLRGSLVGELILDQPVLMFTKDRVEPKSVVKDSADFRRVLDGFMPLRINRCEVNNGKIRYVDNSSSPKVDVELNRLHLLAQNLKNSYDSSSVLPASIDAKASLYEGSLNFQAKLNPLADHPTFDMSADLKNTNLVKLNDFFQAYAKVDVNKGQFGLFTEVAAKDGAFAGYVKPLIKELDVLGKEDRNDNLLQKIWEGIAGGVGELFENQRKDQVATKIPFQGTFDSPRTNIWYAVGSVLQNAFIQALQPSIDNEISIGSVEAPKQEKKTFLQKIFGSDKKDKKGK